MSGNLDFEDTNTILVEERLFSPLQNELGRDLIWVKDGQGKSARPWLTVIEDDKCCL